MVLRRKLSREKLLAWLANQEPCLIGMEACCGAHHLARRLAAQGHGRKRRFRPADAGAVRQAVRQDAQERHRRCRSLRRGGAAAADASSASRSSAPIKSQAQLDVQALRRVPDRLVGMRTGLINRIRGFLLERGVTVARGRRHLGKALPALLEGQAQEPGALLQGPIERLRELWRGLGEQIGALDEPILAHARDGGAAERLMAIPGVGPMLATALVAAVGSAAGSQNGRSLACWLGLVPQQRSTGGKARLGKVARHGNRYLRRLLAHAARPLKRVALGRGDRLGRWLQGLGARAHANVATVALAAKLARVGWAILARGESYRATP